MLLFVLEVTKSVQFHIITCSNSHQSYSIFTKVLEMDALEANSSYRFIKSEFEKLFCDREIIAIELPKVDVILVIKAKDLFIVVHKPWFIHSDFVFNFFRIAIIACVDAASKTGNCSVKIQTSAFLKEGLGNKTRLFILAC